MKKILLGLLLSLSFMFIGASSISAKTPLSSGSSIKLLKNFRVNGGKFANKTISKKCNAKFGLDCEQELSNLIEINNDWQSNCGAGQTSDLCWWLEWTLEGTGNAYNHCVDPIGYPQARNTEVIDRKKLIVKETDTIG